MTERIKINTGGGEFATGNFALTTSLMTVGFPWFDEDQPCHNVYANGARPERGAGGRLKKLGAVTFYLGRRSQTFPEMKLDEALDAYDGKAGAGEELDRLIDGDGNVPKGEVRRLLGLAYLECARNTLANLREVKLMPNMVPAHIRFLKDDGLPVVVSENIDQETADAWGIDIGKGVLSGTR